jgi:murein DD-endopeptidase MepM/ murein hydrolase activator NlpD
LGEALRRLRKKKVSVVFAPAGTGANRALRFSFFRLYVVAGCCFVLAAAFLFVSLQYANHKDLADRLASLRAREEGRNGRIAAICREREILQRELFSYATFDNDLRVVHDLKTIPTDVRKAGVGGPFTELTALMKVGRDKNVDDLELTLRQAQLQCDSFGEILKDQTRSGHIFNHTPSVKPTAGPIVSGFCWRRDPIFGGVQFHKGLDIAFPTGTPILAPADGTVTFAGMKTGYGYCVFIRHGYGFETRYGHCSQLLVREGQPVKRGDVIACVGATGWAVGPHLHYELLVSGTHVDPAQYILPDYLTD